jgi:mannosyltransferase OCH1-like enzyme
MLPQHFSRPAAVAPPQEQATPPIRWWSAEGSLTCKTGPTIIVAIVKPGSVQTSPQWSYLQTLTPTMNLC